MSPIGKRSRTSLLLAALVVGFLFLQVPSCASMHRIKDNPDGTSSSVFVTTNDGKRLALTRIEPERKRPGIPPVLLLHDVFTNRWSFDLDSEHSLGRYLARSGLDVWIGEFRGHGKSQGPSWHNCETYDWNFDDLALRDVPALAGAVAERTGQSGIMAAAHGIGGTALLAHLAAEENSPVRAAVLLGVPGGFVDPSDILRTLASLAPRADDFSAVPTERGWDVPAPFEGSEETLFSLLLFNDQSVNPRILEDFRRRATSRFSIGTARQLAAWIEQGSFCSSDGSIDYYARLESVRIPLLLLAGKIDVIAAPGDALRVLDAVGSIDKTFVLLSKARRFSIDYGHMGMLLSDQARKEVFPLVRDWLLEREKRESGDAPK